MGRAAANQMPPCCIIIHAIKALDITSNDQLGPGTKHDNDDNGGAGGLAFALDLAASLDFMRMCN